MNTGMLIAFEGIDGTGKSSQLKMLAGFLEENGHQVVTTFEPTNSSYGLRIRELYKNRSSCTPDEELALFLEDRRLHVRELIEPERAAGKIVLTDRYYYSTAAYQGTATGEVGSDVKHIFALNSFAPQPELVILLTMEPELSIERIRQGRGEELNDFEQFEQLRQVAERFALFDDPCICRIDASRDMKQVQDAIRAVVEEKISRFPGKSNVE